MNAEEAQLLVRQYSAGKTIGGAEYSFGHVMNVARAARVIAACCGLDEEKAHVYGTLHDIGRLLVCDSRGELELDDRHRHPVRGYKLLASLGLTDEARICITHAFLDRRNTYSDLYSAEDNAIVERVLSEPYGDYDLILQLADGVATVNGVCPMETRLVRKMLEGRHSERDLEDFRCLLRAKEHLDKKAGINLYSVLFRDPSQVEFV